MHDKNYGVSEAQVKQAHGLLDSVRSSLSERTIEDNIDLKIQAAEQEVIRLKQIKENLGKSGLLPLKIEELRIAMQF